MIGPDLSPVGNHLWQSTLSVGVVWLLTLALKNNRAAVRYGLWLAASLKFLLPFSLLVAAGSRFGWRTAPPAGQPSWSLSLQPISHPFVPPASPVVASHAANPWPAILMAAWFCGFAASILLWFCYWRRMRTARRQATPLNLDLPVRVAWSPAPVEPGVFGILHPVLLLPEGIRERLTSSQLDAILAHEMCHVRRRDNLTAAIHLVVEAVFWFHPLVWWIRTRLVDERERACDEAVLHAAFDPPVYAEGILRVCQFYVQAPPCVAGVSGGALRNRLARILAPPSAAKLGTPKKLLLASAAVAAIAGPLAIGIVDAPPVRAQSQPTAQPRAAFEVASVKPAPRDAGERSVTHHPGARLSTSNATVRQLIYLAYQVMPYQLSGGPDWIDSDGFDIEAKATNPKATPSQFRQMIQTLLADRFQLKFHMVTKEMPILELVVAKNGPKLVESANDDPEVTMRNGRGTMTGVKATMAMLAGALTRPLQQKVVDATGLKGAYTFELKFVPDENSTDGPTLTTALREQLGLNVRPARGPVEVFVIDSAAKPAAN